MVRCSRKCDVAMGVCRTGDGEPEKSSELCGEVRVWKEEGEMETQLEDIFQNAL